MKNPVNIAKKGYNKILQIDGLIAHINSLQEMQKNTLEQITDLKTHISNLEIQNNVLQEKNDYLQELICANVDIEKAPTAKGFMRLAQLANFNLLLVFKNICEKNNLEFYLNFGSLLGAVRHKGYIPWDDDIDVMMIREDYNKLIAILEKAFLGTKLFFVHSEIIRIYYGNTPMQLDVFPSDFYQSPVKDEADRHKLGKKLIKLHFDNIKFDWSKLNQQSRTIVNLTYPEIEKLRISSIGPDISKKDAAKIHPAIYHGIEKSSIRDERSVQDYDWIYPLKKLSFEGTLMPVPNQPDRLLSHYYGDYMLWPNKILPKHDDIQTRTNQETINILKDIVNNKINILEKSK